MLKFTKKDYRELAEKVESGEYFSEAREWYLRTYIYNFIERSYIVVFLIGLLFLMFMCNVYYRAILPIKKSLPVQVNITDAGDQLSLITYIGNAKKDFNINYLYIKYFSGRFVEAIESYDYRDNFKRLRINKNFIDILGSKDILSYYLDKISIRNSDSLIAKYRKKVNRTINVDYDKIDFAKIPDDKITLPYEGADSKNPDVKQYAVTVNFTATENDKDLGQTKSNWQAKIVLSFQTITYNFQEKEFSPFNFKVLSYESKKID